MADWSLNHNNFNPQTATHSIIFFEQNPTKMTLVSHMNDKSINNGESIANMKHNNAVLEKHIFNDNLGLDEVIDLDFDKN